MGRWDTLPAGIAKLIGNLLTSGRGLGHEKQYYESVDQRLLGDEDFIEKVVERAPRA